MLSSKKGRVGHYKMTLKGRGKFYKEFTPEMSEQKLFQLYSGNILSYIHREIKPNY